MFHRVIATLTPGKRCTFCGDRITPANSSPSEGSCRHCYNVPQR